jgi:hypothetical protein
MSGTTSLTLTWPYSDDPPAQAKTGQKREGQ